MLILFAIILSYSWVLIKMDYRNKELGRTNAELKLRAEELQKDKDSLEAEISRLRTENEELRKVEEFLEQYELQSFEATAYAGDGITATGTVPDAGKTVAVDPNVIPLGSEVYVEGHGKKVAEDTGGMIKGRRIDIFMASREEAIEFGRRDIYVAIQKE